MVRSGGRAEACLLKALDNAQSAPSPRSPQGSYRTHLHRCVPFSTPLLPGLTHPWHPPSPRSQNPARMHACVCMRSVTFWLCFPECVSTNMSAQKNIQKDEDIFTTPDMHLAKTNLHRRGAARAAAGESPRYIAPTATTVGDDQISTSSQRARQNKLVADMVQRCLGFKTGFHSGCEHTFSILKK